MEYCGSMRGRAVWPGVLLVCGVLMGWTGVAFGDTRGPAVGVDTPREPYGLVPFPSSLAGLDRRGEPEAPIDEGGAYLVNYEDEIVGVRATFLVTPADPRGAKSGRRSRPYEAASRGLVKQAEKGLQRQAKDKALEDFERAGEWLGWIGPATEPRTAYHAVYRFKRDFEERVLVLVGVATPVNQMLLRVSFPASESEEAEVRLSTLLLDWGYLVMKGRQPAERKKRRG